MSVIVFVSVGLGLIAGGLYWHLWDDSTAYLSSFISSGDRYYELMQFMWDAIPVILLLLGVLCLVMGGVSHSRRRQVIE